MSGVKIEHSPGLGNVLVATQAFEPGQAVVHERPLLHVPQLKPSSPLHQPLQAYTEQHRVPPSVVLKILAFVTASPSTQASVLRCFCPDTTAYADASVVRQARAFATCLLQHPPVPEFTDWAASAQTTPAQEADAASGAAAGAAAAPSSSSTASEAEQQVQQQQPSAFDMLVRVWLIWVLNGHSFKMGSALFDYGSKLTHTCAAPNTMYRTAKGDIAPVVESVDGSSSGSSSSGLQQQQQPGAVPAAGGGASAAGSHVALTHITPGDLLTTNYLGMGHKRLMSTAARQKYLQDKFLFKCTCHRCTHEFDLARGIPCPSCSGAFRSDDKLLQELEALPDWQLGSSLLANTTAAVTTAAAAAAGAGTQGSSMQDSSASEAVQGSSAEASGSHSSGASSGSKCGYIYCNMAELMAGSDRPWECDACEASMSDDTAELWGRFYTKSHTTIESEMEGWVNRLDASMDSAPLVRDPAVLHQRVLGVVRLLGPRHWASWRLLLLGVELHCGALEEATIKAQMQQSRARRRAQAAADAAAPVAPGPEAANTCSSTVADADIDSAEPAHDAAAAANITQLAVWIVRYCKQLWAAVGGKYGEVEAGQVLGYHFSEACQVLLQIASESGLFRQRTSNGLVDAALQLQLLVLPGVRTVMGAAYNPLVGLLGADGFSAAGGGQHGMMVADAEAVSAALRRQQQQRAAEASQMMSLVQQLKQLEARERV